jgi:hypothetical protein
MDQPDDSVAPVIKADGDLGEPISTRAYILAAFIIVAGMILWAVAMIGY